MDSRECLVEDSLRGSDFLRRNDPSGHDVIISRTPFPLVHVFGDYPVHMTVCPAKKEVLLGNGYVDGVKVLMDSHRGTKINFFASGVHLGVHYSPYMPGLISYGKFRSGYLGSSKHNPFTLGHDQLEKIIQLDGSYGIEIAVSNASFDEARRGDHLWRYGEDSPFEQGAAQFTITGPTMLPVQKYVISAPKLINRSSLERMQTQMYWDEGMRVLQEAAANNSRLNSATITMAVEYLDRAMARLVMVDVE